jgi:hypothetical protein
MKLRALLRKIRPNPKPLSGEGERSVDNVDAWAAGSANKAGDPMLGNLPATFPPNYVPPVDEGRPRH